MADLTEELVTSPAQVLAWIRKGESKTCDEFQEFFFSFFFLVQAITSNTFSVPSLSREPTLWQDKNEPAEQPIAHYFPDGKKHIATVMWESMEMHFSQWTFS